jgi:anthranilate synthase component 1
VSRLPLRERIRRLEEQLAKSASDFDIVPIALEFTSDTLTPVGSVENFLADQTGFLLESVEDGQRFGRFSFLGRKPLGTYVENAEHADAQGIFSALEHDSGALGLVDSYLTTTKVAPPIGDAASFAPLRSGVVGVFGWDVVRSIETLPPRRTSDSTQPDCALMAIGELVAFDHWRQAITLIVNLDTASLRANDAASIGDVVTERMQQMIVDLEKPTSTSLRAHRQRDELPLADCVRTITSEQYQGMVNEAKQRIADGDIFQIVLSQRFDVGPVGDPFAVYRELRRINPSAYLYYLKFPEVTVVGSSPEALVRVRDGRVTTRPIAGSRPRSDDDDENQRRAEELRNDPKEIAEHVMLVDLGRNDIGRVSEYGSVRVEELMTVEMYSHIMHLTSQVSGTLRPDVTSVDVLRATFPAGTLSGAPKVRAMQLITEMEPQSRGLYGGAIGYFDFGGNLDAAIIIRTMVVDAHGNGSVQTGAGLVWDSDPRSEDDEALAKAEAVLRAIGSARS